MCLTLKITIINSHWLSLLQGRKQQQKRLCCPWKEKKCLRQIEYLSLYGSVPYTFPELCASECAWASANQWPVFNVEAIEVSVSTGQCQLPQWGVESGVHYVALLLVAGAVQTFRQRGSALKHKISLTALHLFAKNTLGNRLAEV